MHATEAIRIIALRDVWLRHINKADDPDYNRRKIFMYYSVHFNTPLHVVESLPLLDVLRAYWEHSYGALSEDDLEAAVRQAALTDEELKGLDDKDDMGELAFDALAAAVASGAYGNLATAPAPAGMPKPAPKGPRRSTLKEAEIAPKIDIKDLEKLPESISIKFSDDDADFEMEGDGLGLLEMPPPRAAKPPKR